MSLEGPRVGARVSSGPVVRSFPPLSEVAAAVPGAQVRGAEEVDVGGQVLAQDLESQSAPPLRKLGCAAVEALLGLRLDPANLSKQFRRHGETVAWTDKKVKLGANLCRSNSRR